MERKKRTLFAVLTATIIVLAVFSSFAINLLNQEEYEIKLPDLTQDENSGSAGNQDQYEDHFVRVDVTAETVQSVIGTLSRPLSYYREINIELWADDETSAVTAALVWVDNGWIRSSVTGPSGRTQHNLVGDGTRWLWYDQEKTALSFPADETVLDLVQRIPTYEDVLELPKSRITATGYETYLGSDCIFVEFEQPELNSKERYWIAVSDGLLVAAERVKEDQVVYRMTALSTVSPAPLNSSFALPDGTVLHSLGESET